MKKGDKVLLEVTQEMCDGIDWDGYEYITPGYYPVVLMRRSPECDSEERGRAWEVRFETVRWQRGGVEVSTENVVMTFGEKEL